MSGAGAPPPPGCELLTVTVARNESGYGMKVSGDNPVYVQSVKEGGAAWRAGLRAGDRIVRVNGVLVHAHTHLHVVQMIRATPNVVITVYQNMQKLKTPITAPVPVDQEKQRQLEFTKVHTIRLMLDNEQKHMELLRNELMESPDPRKRVELESAEQRCLKLQHQIDIITSSLPTNQDLTSSSPQLTQPQTPKLGSRTKQTNLDKNSAITNSTGFLSGLPRSLSNLTGQSLRNLRQVRQNMTNKSQQENQPPLERQNSDDSSTKRSRQHNNTVPMVPVTCLDGNIAPPPLPPRTINQKSRRNPLSPPPSHIPINPLAKPKMLSPSSSLAQSPAHRWNSPQKDVNSPFKTKCITQQFSMDEPQGQMHKSSSSPQYRREEPSPQNKYRRSAHSLDVDRPDLGNGQPNSIAMQMSYPLVSHPLPSIQMGVHTPSGIPVLHTRSQSSPEHLDHGRSQGESEAWQRSPPPGTPPPPYPHPVDTQRAIISMEEDDEPTSDNSVHSGLFSNLRSVRDSRSRMAVLLNWLLCEKRCASANLFLLITDGYRSALGVPVSVLRRWAYEIQSTFVMPGAVLALNGVDENMAREIDDILLNEYHKEELLRNVFRKARAKAKEELAQQLSEFQVKRQVGLGVLYGPEDHILEKCEVDKSQEAQVVEALLTERLGALAGGGAGGDVWGCGAGSPAHAPLLAAAAAAAAVLHVRPQAVTAAVGGGARAAFLQRDKPYKQRLKLITKQTPQPFVIRGHHFSLQAITSVADCQHCCTVIWGLAPQAYVCNDCSLRVHRVCAKRVEESCCLDGEQSNNRISRFIEKIHHNSGHQESNDKKSRKTSGTALFLNAERVARKTEDEPLWDQHHNSPGDTRREAGATDASAQDPADCAQEASHDKEDHKDGILWRSAATSGGKPVNRAESCREPAAAARRGKQRNASDPNRLTANKQHDCEPGAAPGAGSGSSSSSSLSTCSAESAPAPDPRAASQSDFSEEEEPLAEAWSATVAPQVAESLCARLRKRQELAHELITSESSHVRWLKVLQVVFLRPLEREAPGLLPPDEVRALFPNLPAVRERHTRLYADLKALRKDSPIVHIGPLADAVLNTLGDPSYAKVLSKFCCGQRMALDALRERRRKNKELHQYLSSKEQDQLCGRLQLRDLMAVVWQRLTKYQLLLEGVLRTVQDSDCEDEAPERGDDVARLRRALDTAKDVLHRVDTAVRTAENEHRLKTIQSKLEVRGGELEDARLDLTQHTLLFEGALGIRTDNKKTTVLALMTPDFLILLQREGDKFLLKPMGQLTPIIKWSTVLFRPNAAVKNTFFLMNINCLQMYELSANNLTEYNTWTKYISEMPLAEGRAMRAPSVAHSRERTDDSSGGGVSRNASDASRTSASSTTLEDVPDAEKSTPDPALPVQGSDKSASDADKPVPEQDKSASEPEGPTDATEKTVTQSDEAVGKQTSSDASGDAPGAAERPRPALTTTGRITTHEFDPPPLAAAVHAETIATTLVATKVLSSEERLRRLDEEIARAMRAKSALVAELLGVPGENLALVEDMAVEESLGHLDTGEGSGVDLHQLLLAAQAQANQITQQLTRALQASDADVLTARHAGAGAAARRRGEAAGLCDKCGTRRAGKKRTEDAEQHIAAAPEAECGAPVPPALSKELSYDMLAELDATELAPWPRSGAGAVLLEEIGESSTDPLTPPIGGVADACLATRLVPLACGLQSTLVTLLHAAPGVETERRRLKQELATLRDQYSALRHAHAVLQRPAEQEVNPSSIEPDATQSKPADTADAAGC